jgi:hypothetical protein
MSDIILFDQPLNFKDKEFSSCWKHFLKNLYNAFLETIKDRYYVDFYRQGH